MLPMGFILITILAATRMNIGTTFVLSIWYGVFGEAYNAAYSFSQTTNVSLTTIESFWYLIQVIFQPVVYPVLELLLKMLPEFSEFKSATIIYDAVKYQTGERLAPMGGWYLPATFAPFHWFGVLFMMLYYLFTVAFTKFLFNGSKFPVHLLFGFLIIKATPAVYINFLIYYFLVFYILKHAQKMRFLVI